MVPLELSLGTPCQIRLEDFKLLGRLELRQAN